MSFCIHGDTALAGSRSGGRATCPSNAEPIHIKPRGAIGALCDPPWRKRLTLPHVESGNSHGATCEHCIPLWRELKRKGSAAA